MTPNESDSLPQVSSAAQSVASTPQAIIAVLASLYWPSALPSKIEWKPTAAPAPAV